MPSETFELHPRLAADCITLGRFALSWLLLMNESRYPWFILVPERAGIREIHHLPEADRMQLMRESAVISAALENWFRPDKLNIGAIGNLVPQLHVHHVARFTRDAAWPAPVWGRFTPEPYARAEIEALQARVDAAEWIDFRGTC